MKLTAQGLLVGSLEHCSTASKSLLLALQQITQTSHRLLGNLTRLARLVLCRRFVRASHQSRTAHLQPQISLLGFQPENLGAQLLHLSCHLLHTGKGGSDVHLTDDLPTLLSSS